jgi:hypothetical protein
LQAANNKIVKIPENYIKYKSSAHIDSKTWKSSEKDILDKFQESRARKSFNELPTVSKQGLNLSFNELPAVNKHGLNQSFNSAGAKEAYDHFRKRQPTAANFGKMNAFLMSLKKKESEDMKNL